MKKVIVKCHLKSHDDFVKKLSDIDMDFGPTFWQHDRVYLPRGYKAGQNFPRLIMRTEMKAVDKPARYYIILRRHIEDSGVDIVDSTVVKDYAEAVNIIHQLGFKKQAEVSRKRTELAMGEGVKIYLDNIEGLNGYYAKMEATLEEGESVSSVRQDMIKTFKVLNQDKIIEKPYADLL